MACLRKNNIMIRLIQCRLDHSKFMNMQKSLERKTIIEKIVDDFELMFTFRATCAKKFGFLIQRSGGPVCVGKGGVISVFTDKKLVQSGQEVWKVQIHTTCHRMMRVKGKLYKSKCLQ